MTDKQRVLDFVDSLTASERMTVQEALEFLRELMTDLESRVEGMKDDLKVQARRF